MAPTVRIDPQLKDGEQVVQGHIGNVAKNLRRRSAGPARACPDMTQSRRKRDRSNENITKKWKTLVKRGGKLRRQNGAEVYIYIKTPRWKQYLFLSHRNMTPLAIGEAVRIPLPTYLSVLKNLGQAISTTCCSCRR